MPKIKYVHRNPVTAEEENPDYGFMQVLEICFWFYPAWINTQWRFLQNICPKNK